MLSLIIIKNHELDITETITQIYHRGNIFTVAPFVRT